MSFDAASLRRPFVQGNSDTGLAKPRAAISPTSLHLNVEDVFGRCERLGRRVARAIPDVQRCEPPTDAVTVGQPRTNALAVRKAFGGIGTGMNHSQSLSADTAPSSPRFGRFSGHISSRRFRTRIVDSDGSPFE
jgi:hypothetical protein